VPQLVFHPQQLGCFAFQEPSGGNSGPRGHHVSNVVGAHLLLEHDGLARFGLRQRRVELLLDLGNPPVSQLGRLGQVAVALGPVGFAAQGFQLLFEIAHHVNGVLLVLPPGGQLGQLLAEVREFTAKLFQTLLGRRIGFLGQSHLFDLESANQPFHFVDLDGPRVDLHAEP